MGVVRLFEDFHFSNGEEGHREMQTATDGFDRTGREWSVSRQSDLPSKTAYDTTGFSNRQLKGKTRVSTEDTLILDTPEWTVVIPHTHRAACYWGKGAHWCTALGNGGGEKFFNRYTKNGDLIIIHDKEENMKYQLHINLGMFYDQNDHGVNCGDFFSANPEVLEAIESHITPEEQRAFSQLCGM